MSEQQQPDGGILGFWKGVVGQSVAAAVLGAILWGILQTTIPAIVSNFNDRLREERQEHRLESRQRDEGFLRALEQQRQGWKDATDKLVGAMQELKNEIQKSRYLLKGPKQ